MKTQLEDIFDQLKPGLFLEVSIVNPLSIHSGDETTKVRFRVGELYKGDYVECWTLCPILKPGSSHEPKTFYLSRRWYRSSSSIQLEDKDFKGLETAGSVRFGDSLQNLTSSLKAVS